MGKKETKNVERPQSAQELALLETQNQQLQKGIAVAENQEARSQEQHEDWKRAYLPMETGMIGSGATRENGYQSSGKGGVRTDGRMGEFRQQMDNQMPRYKEDTSGVRR